jgi:hypothetical protein
MGHSNSSRWVLVALLSAVPGISDSYAAGKKPSSISIAKDDQTGQIVVSWSGKGVLKQATADGRFRPVRARGNSYVVEPTEEQTIFVLESGQAGPIVSVNAVGYVNVMLPPGLSLIANPLISEMDTVSEQWPKAPDGAQVLKYVPESGYEVSTFDGLAEAWSNPDFAIPIGQGFFFRNTSAETMTQTFVGEVPQGRLVVYLPAGPSMKGALVPQTGSINTIHQIPGQDGDLIRLWVNDDQGGGDYIDSVFISSENGWVPDLELRVAQGFWIEKQQAQEWVRVFSVY